MAFWNRKKGQNLESPDKIVHLPRILSWMNIGTLLFGTILIYIFITLILYLTQKHVTTYEVVSGTISGNYRYSALALKTEEVVTAGESGSVTYYAREGAKANEGMMVCAVGPQSASADSSQDNTDKDKTSVSTNLSDEDKKSFQDEMATFAINFSPQMFQNVYDFKSDLQGVILQSSIDENAGNYLSGSYLAPSSGFVIYSTDGFEDTKAEDLTSELFDESSYKKDNLRLKGSVSAGDPLYSLITDDSWELTFPVDDKLKTELEGTQKIHVRFLKDSNTFYAPFELIKGKDGGTYGKISMTSYLVRYVTDRFLDIELILNRTQGLKIPVSAVAQKTFVKIPEEYVTVNDSTSGEIFLEKESFKKDGTKTDSNLTATVYAKDSEEGFYLVNPDLFKTGDYVVMPGTTKKYQITDDTMEKIQGVYNVNKGYAVFREVNIVDENEEFCIVDPNNVYGLNAHDRIVLDASQVEQDEIINT